MAGSDRRNVEAIYTYAHGMDRKLFDLAVSVIAPDCEIDYSAVGGPKARMTREEVQTFLSNLLGKPDLAVHTAIDQVLQDPTVPDMAIAYYSVRHFLRAPEGQSTFFVYGWYEFTMGNGLIEKLAIRVQAMEGDPTILS